jgi:hypothetical protein
VFSRCDFLLGQDDTVVIVIPAHLPRADTYTVSVSSRDIRFKAGYDKIAEIPYQGGDIYKRIANNVQIGLVEYPRDGSEFPNRITKVAYVEVRRAT